MANKTVPQETVLKYVAEVAEASGFIDRVVLFGSRAKGNPRPWSDYDLAVKLAPGTERKKWLAFTVNADEDAPTLCQLSFVEWTETLRPELAENIAKEGVLVYER